jgi:methyltransferase (TIGR00027 family)
MLNNMTALVSCFARSYHTLNSNIKIYDDEYARKMLSDEEYNNISLSMTSGIEFFDSSYEGNNTLGFIVNNHLAPAVLARSSFNERHLNNEIRLGLSQYVILGSGYDTSAYKVNDKVKVFELDKEEMICDKKKRVLKGKIDCSNVSYIGCDFNNDNWMEILKNTGFDSDKKTLWSMLGVSYYLDRDVFFETIKLLAENMSSGSSIIFDYPTLEDDENKTRKEALAKATNEDMKGRYSREDILNVSRKFGLKVYEDLGSNDINNDYFYDYNTLNPDLRIYAPEGINYCLLVK